jgi:hypothetical protein
VGHRFSSLPIAQFCGLAPQLSAQGGAGRAAALGSAFHARCADPEGAEAKERWARLDREEQEDVARWIKPSTLVLENGTVLDYATAFKELPLGLTAQGAYAPKGTPGNITEGTCDICWLVEQDGLRIVYVPDIKSSEWTVADGPDSLQILGYAYAAAQQFGADGYCAGIWAAKEGRWWWGDLFLFGFDDEAILGHWQRIKAAALNDNPEPAHGPHCRSCYGRTRCPAWMMPPSLLGTELEPFAKEGFPITGEHAAALLLKLKQLEDVAKLVKANLQDMQRQGHRILDGNGKEWRPISMPGKVVLDAVRFEKEEPALFERYAKESAPYEQWRWCNAEPKKKGK